MIDIPDNTKFTIEKDYKGNSYIAFYKRDPVVCTQWILVKGWHNDNNIGQLDEILVDYHEKEQKYRDSEKEREDVQRKTELIKEFQESMTLLKELGIDTRQFME